MNILNKVVSFLLVVILAAAAVPAFGEDEAASGTEKKAGIKVGIAFPNKNFEIFSNAAERMISQLEANGCEVILKYCDNNVKKQKSQIKSLIKSGCKVLVVAAVDPGSLDSELTKAKKKKIQVIGFYRMPWDTKAVSYYVSFDNAKFGELQAKYIVDALHLDEEKGPFNIEFTAGDPYDSSGKEMFKGAMSVLKPYISSGKLVVKSGQKSYKKTATELWRTANAQKRAEKILKSSYSDGSTVDAWLCLNDSTAYGVISALEKKYKGKWPVITGQDCDVLNMKKMLAGKQAMSVYRDSSPLADQTVKMILQIAHGAKVETNGKVSNGKKKVPSCLCAPVVVDLSNYREYLTDSVYASELGLE